MEQTGDGGNEVTEVQWAGPPPEGKVLIFGQEALCDPRGNGFNTKALWYAELFPFHGVIKHRECFYEWGLGLHMCFHSRGTLGHGAEREFADALAELEKCAKAYFESMEWFMEDRFKPLIETDYAKLESRAMAILAVEEEEGEE
jgi:hypothetical protein